VRPIVVLAVEGETEKKYLNLIAWLDQLLPRRSE